MTDPAAREDVVARGRERATELTTARTVQQLLDLYTEVSR